MTKNLIGQEKVFALLNREYSKLLGREARYRYFEDEKKNRYFYTTEKIEHKGNARYVAGIYRYLKTKKVFKLVKKVGFAKKYKAIKWAQKQKDISKNNSELISI